MWSPITIPLPKAQASALVIATCFIVNITLSLAKRAAINRGLHKSWAPSRLWWTAPFIYSRLAVMFLGMFAYHPLSGDEATIWPITAMLLIAFGFMVKDATGKIDFGDRTVLKTGERGVLLS